MPSTEKERLEAWFERELLPIADASMLTGIPREVIMSAIESKKVWAYRVTRPEWSYESWVVNMTSLRRYAGHLPAEWECNDVPDTVKVL